MSISRSRLAPKIGHLERMKRLYGYHVKTKHFAIRYRTKEPEYSHLPNQEYEWTTRKEGSYHHIHRCQSPPQHCNRNISISCIALVNTTPTDWFLKRQATVKTATYGSEFVAAKTATEQIMHLRNTLRYIGVSIMTKVYMFGDNKSVIMSSTTSIHPQ